VALLSLLCGDILLHNQLTFRDSFSLLIAQSR